MPPVIRPGTWPEVIQKIAETYQNGEVEWFIPGSQGTYNAAEDTYTGGTEAVYIGTSAARIQHIREPRNVATGYEWTNYRRFRFQIPHDDITLAIVKGVCGKITNGGRDERLVGVIVQVQSAVNSSHAAIRTVEGIAENTGPAPEGV